ncbi:MAG: T9SS type A sorting domain-containing protein, partial [Bacteroidia bacterium]|nr:T9SS type A sorting domain-containing protein [Bacteroidia bacterium]
SPIFDLGNNTTITISFWQNYATEFAADGLLIEYSTNGVTWQPLGTIGDPNGTNWYNATIFQGKEAWCGNSGGWVNSIYNYQKPWGNNFLQLRYVFVSDVALVNAGVSIDDINITGIVGLSDISESLVVISPNPANDFVSIFNGRNNNKIRLIQIFDATGKLLLHQDGNNETSQILETGNLSSGIYSVVLHFQDGSRQTKKVAIQH